MLMATARSVQLFQPDGRVVIGPPSHVGNLVRNDPVVVCSPAVDGTIVNQDPETIRIAQDSLVRIIHVRPTRLVLAHMESDVFPVRMATPP